MFELSIVIPTRNRADALLKALMAIEHATHSTYEVIVVDRASTDATQGVLMLASSIMGTRLRVVREDAGVGFGSACTKGIAIAQGRNLCVLHDDVHPLDGALDRAIAQLDDAADVQSILALPTRQNLNDDIAHHQTIDGISYATTHLRATLVAPFPFARRSTFISVGFDGSLKSSVAAIDFSLRGWSQGHQVVPALASSLESHVVCVADDLVSAAEREAVIARWGLPPAGVKFDPKAPCSLRKREMRKAA